ncbi:MAG: hypothetical protein HRT69_16065, partial [Flavobacteriaceae bacterium]|nr:hypothetical protein [Flavobacteriaceae bacterium]
MKAKLFLLTLFIGLISYAQIPTTDLEGEYKFTSGSLNDTFGTNHFTQTGSALTQITDSDGVSTDAVSLNGDHLTRSTFSSSNLSLSFWVKTSTNDTTKRTIIDQTNRTSDADNLSGDGYYAYLKDGKVGVAANYYYWYNTNISYTDYSGFSNTEGTTDVSDDKWHHVVFTAEYSTYYVTNQPYVQYTYKVYIDGELEDTNVVSNGTIGNAAGVGTRITPPVSITVANGKNANLVNRYQDGIDNIRYYTNAISETEVTQLFNEFTCFPQGLSVSNIANTSADVSWSSSSTGTTLRYVQFGFPFSAGTDITNISGNTQAISGLTANTSYDVYVQGNCNGNTTEWTLGVNFTTLSGNTIYVNHAAVGANDGSTWRDAYTSLEDGLAAATSNNMVWVAQGTYIPTTINPNPRKATFNVLTGTKVYGGFFGGEAT